MQVICASEKDKDRWDQYVLNQKGSTPYHLFGWKGVIEKTYHHETRYFMVLDDETRVRGILPLTIIKSLFFGRFAVSVSFCNYGGVCGDDISRDLLLEQATEVMECEDLQYVELRNYSNKVSWQKTYKGNCTMVLKLTKNFEELWNSFKPKVRNQVRKAERSGLVVKTGQEYVDEFYKIYSHNMRDLGTPVHSKKLFLNLISEFGESVNISSVLEKGTTVAAMFVIQFKDTLFNVWASSLKKYLKFCPNNLLYWNIIKYGCENGFRYFDFGRCKLKSGTFNFKKQWGADPIQLNYQFICHNNDMGIPIIDSNKLKYKLFTHCWNKMPLVMTNFFGPKLRRYIA